MLHARAHLPTLREAPAEATHPARALLLRGAWIRQVTPGHHAWLPLGVGLLSALQDRLRAALVHLDGQEILLPPMAPPEEGAHTLASLTLLSWRACPQTWFTVDAGPAPLAGTSWVDDAPRTLRTWTFHLPDATPGPDLLDTFAAAFGPLGLPGAPVGDVAGGRAWFVASAQGDAAMLRCPACGVGWLLDAAPGPTAPAAPVDTPASPPCVPFPTPGVRTIRDLESPPYGVPATRQLKTLVMKADGTLVVAVVPGDRDLCEAKLQAIVGARHLEPARPEEIRARLGALPGSLGAVGTHGIPVHVDRSLTGARDRVTGANRDDHHLAHVDVDRDLAHGTLVDLARARPGDPCPRCGSPLEPATGLVLVRVGPVRPIPADPPPSVTGPDGSRLPLSSRAGTVALHRVALALAEAHAHADGVAWPAPVAPVAASVLCLAPRDPDVARVARDLHDALVSRGVPTLLDDRDERAGVKFKDADLVGAPLRLSVGPRGLATGAVEWKDRSDPTTTAVSLDGAVDRVVARLRDLGRLG